MRVEVLYVADCPARAPAVEMLAGVFAEAGMTAEIQQVLVRDEAMARQLRFRGSPTIRIDGRDVENTPAGAATFGVCCRLYRGSPLAGVPPLAMIQRAVREARERKAEP
jgi:protein-disulfide isomerase